MKDTNTISEIYWNEYHAAFADTAGINYGEIENKEMEVIGNIYEQPELLKK